MSLKRYLPWIIIITLLLLLSISFFVIFETKIFRSKASELTQTVSASQSYVFTSPLEAKCSDTGVKESIRITVYTLDETGKGIADSRIKFENMAKLKIHGAGVTDVYGMTIFDVTCESGGEYYLKVIINDQIRLPQQVHLSFR